MQVLKIRKVRIREITNVGCVFLDGGQNRSRTRMPSNFVLARKATEPEDQADHSCQASVSLFRGQMIFCSCRFERPTLFLSHPSLLEILAYCYTWKMLNIFFDNFKGGLEFCKTLVVEKYLNKALYERRLYRQWLNESIEK